MSSVGAAEYLVPAQDGRAEYTVKKSLFIGHVRRVSDESEAQAFIDAVSREHADATHNVWAYLLRSGAMKWSDDGEPGGTAGQPVLNVFRSAAVFDVVCVVTRYFGGILLGSGGLVRAYSKAAALALGDAGISTLIEWVLVSLTCFYAQYERVCRLFESFGCDSSALEAEFAVDVEVKGRLPADRAEEFAAQLIKLSAGTSSPSFFGSVFLPKKFE